MRNIKVRVYKSSAKLKKKEQLAWKIAEIASDKAPLNEDAIDMVINRIIDNASVAIASLNRNKLNLKGSELITIINIEKGLTPGQDLECEIKFADGVAKKINLLSRIDTANEVEYYKNDGILKYVLRSMVQ